MVTRFFKTASGSPLIYILGYGSFSLLMQIGVNKVAYYDYKYNVFMVQVEMVVFVINFNAPGVGEEKLDDLEYLYYGEGSEQHDTDNQTRELRVEPDYLCAWGQPATRGGST